ncbi:Homocysteine S-methyltransferase [Peniophora sp. CONT]|nr:Homocysteine S-methyltransferase [Peniophora sp. CONT]
MPTLSTLLGPSPVLYDGGQGTTLADFYGADTSSPVWSSAVVETHPDTVIDLLVRFMTAGSRVVNTATYQAAYSTYALAGHPEPQDAERLMRSAVHLAATARTKFTSSPSSDKAPDVKIALSLGSFGSSLVPVAHEFDGVYPPPYGPSTPSARFPPSQRHEEKEAEDALTQFHLERLRVYAGDEETWKEINMLAFETVPLLREVRAIRRAVTKLYEEGVVEKAWSVSTVWENGVFPEATEEGVEGTVREVLEAFFGEYKGVRVRRPDAFGVNCTLLADAEQIARVASSILPSIRANDTEKEKPWLMLKPNGGKVYDPAAKTWSDDPRAREEGWAKALASVAQEAGGTGTWGGVLVGGCCKTGFEEIGGLGEALTLAGEKVKA